MVGVTVPPIFCSPWAATSLRDFWGRRWNLLARDLLHDLVFRPLAPRGVRCASAAAFAASALLHAYPACAAGASPLGIVDYFLIQASVFSICIGTCACCVCVPRQVVGLEFVRTSAMFAASFKWLRRLSSL